MRGRTGSFFIQARVIMLNESIQTALEREWRRVESLLEICLSKNAPTGFIKSFIGFNRFSLGESGFFNTVMMSWISQVVLA